MTTIVYKDGIMAADTRAFGFDKCPVGKKTKVYKLDDGRLIGVSTALIGIPNAVRKWANEGMKRDAIPMAIDREKVDFEAIIVSADGSCVLLDGNWLPSDPVQSPYYAIGSGKEYALAALLLDCDAKRAVEVASKLDPWTSNDIETVSHK